MSTTVNEEYLTGDALLAYARKTCPRILWGIEAIPSRIDGGKRPGIIASAAIGGMYFKRSWYLDGAHPGFPPSAVPYLASAVLDEARRAFGKILGAFADEIGARRKEGEGGWLAGLEDQQ